MAPVVRIAGQLGGPGPCGCGRLVPAAAGCSLGDAVQGGHDVPVRTVGGSSQVPGPPVGVAGQHLGEGGVRRTALGAGRCAVDRGPNQRVVQRDQVTVDTKQPRALHLVQRSVIGAEPVGGVAHHGEAGRVVGGGGEKEPLPRVRQLAVPIEERPLHATSQGKRHRKRGLTGQLLGREQPGQLDQRQRVAAGLGDQLVAYCGVDLDVPGAGPCGQQRGSIRPGHTAEAERRDVRRLEVTRAALARGEQQCHALVLQTARGEQQRPGRRVVEPLSIVDDRQHRRLLGGLGEQGQRTQVGEVPLALPGALSERGAERSPLGTREVGEPVAERPQQPLQRGEREGGLRLHARRAEHPHPGRRVDRVCQQRRLAHTGYPADDQRATGAGARRIHESGDRRTFRVTTCQHGTDATQPGAPPRQNLAISPA